MVFLENSGVPKPLVSLVQMTNELNEFGVSRLRVFNISLVIQLESNSQRVSVVGAQPDLRVGEGAPIVEAFCWLNVQASW